MNIASASVDQVQQANDGRVVELDPQDSRVAADLEAIDRGLRVRFSQTAECWLIVHKHHPDCPHNGTGGPGSEYLVRSVEAYQGRTGVWSGLDDRIVERFRQIQPGGRAGYDYARELEDGYLARRERAHKDRQDQLGDVGERTAHAMRRDLGLGTYKGRIFLPRGISP